jgi:hypothetical protein
MYDGMTADDRTAYYLHWYVGFGSVLTGVVCFLYALMIGRETETGMQIRDVINRDRTQDKARTIPNLL